jgi:hypothetical protein
MAMPLILLSAWSWDMRLESMSAHKIKRYGDKGSPCLMPLWGLKLGDGVPLTRTKKETVVTQLIILLTSLLGKLIIERVFSRKDHSILS